MSGSQQFLVFAAFIALIVSIAAFLIGWIGRRSLNHATKPMPFTSQSEVFRSKRFHPLNGISGTFKPLFELQILAPSKVFENDDSELAITLTAISPYFFSSYAVEAYPSWPFIDDQMNPPTVKNGYFIELHLDSESLKITPLDASKLPLRQGHIEKFIISPKSTGRKKILVKARLETPSLKEFPGLSELDRYETETVTIEVLSSRTFLGLSKDALQVLQTLAAIIGLPSLIVLLITLASK